MNTIITLILAGIVGWLASLIMKTDGQMGTVANIIVGIVGSMVGTWLFGFISPATPTANGMNISGMVVGVMGACVTIFLWQVLSGKRA